MNGFTRLALAAALAASAGCATTRTRPADTVRVCTYNIRLSPGDRGTANDWDARKADLVRLIRTMDLDAFGLQEVCPDQAQYLRENLPEFAFVGDHREADRKSGEASPVFYRKSRFDAVKSGTFWLSETPDVPASKSWNTRCTRVCSYLVLRDRTTGGRFCFANTHTDHVSAEAREKGMQLVIRRMEEFGAGAPIVFTGDHNNTEVDAPSVAVAKVLRNALYLSETPAEGPWRTFCGWHWREHEVSTAQALETDPQTRNKADWFRFLAGGIRIDYIWVSDGVKVLDYKTWGDPRPGTRLYHSDHFPVTATLRLP